MSALYEDVEKFFGDIFAAYGRFLSRYPIVFILMSFLTSCLLGMGLLSLQFETKVLKLYTPMTSPAVTDQAKLDRIFPDHTSKDFYTHQQIYQSTYGELFILPLADSENVIKVEIIQEIKQLYDEILHIYLEKNEQGHVYADLCASRQGKCVIDGDSLLKTLQRTICIDGNLTMIPDETGLGYEDLNSILSNMDIDENHCLTAKAMRLRFNLRHDSNFQRELSLHWETKFLEKLGNYQAKHCQLFYSASESLDIELGRNAGGGTEFFALAILIMMIYASIVTSGGNWVSTRIELAQAGIFAALLAILASFGLLSMVGMKFVDTCSVMPFLVLGVGVDDMFILLAGWRGTDMKLPIEDRIAETFRTSAISVTITSLTDLLAFTIGATSPFMSVQNFCIFTGVAILLCYINQLTFFGGCLVIHARRVASSRHCLTCTKTKSRKDLAEDGYQKLYICCCQGQPVEKIGEDDSPCEKLPSSLISHILLLWPVKFIIIVGSIIYFAVAIWGALQIQTGMKLENVVPESSYLTSYMSIQQEHFSNQGPYVMFVINKRVDYRDKHIQGNITDVIQKALKTGYIDNDSQISWLEDFLASQPLKKDTTHQEFISLVKSFVSYNTQYAYDIKFNSDQTDIHESRFYVASKNFNNATAEGNMMLRMREIAANSSLEMTAFSPDFIYYDHYVSILKNTLLSVGVAMIGMIFVALMFIPHPIPVTCIIFSMVTIVLGMFGFMHLWGLALSAITTAQIILSVGFCVDFTVHVSHSFMTARGKSRNERVKAALEKVGVPILNGALSSILGILMLAFSSSYILQSFFKTMLLVILLGLAHALFLLPVMLSFIGPRRTNKPRVFFPLTTRFHTDYEDDPRRSSARRRSGGTSQAIMKRSRNASTCSSRAPEEIELLRISVTDCSDEGDANLELPTLDSSQRAPKPSEDDQEDSTTYLEEEAAILPLTSSNRQCKPLDQSLLGHPDQPTLEQPVSHITPDVEISSISSTPERPQKVRYEPLEKPHVTFHVE